METIKTAIIVVLLLAVLYGVYAVLNKPADVPPSEQIAWHEEQAMEPLQIDVGQDAFGGDSAAAFSVPEVPATPANAFPPAADPAAGLPEPTASLDLDQSLALPDQGTMTLPELPPSASFAEPDLPREEPPTAAPTGEFPVTSPTAETGDINTAAQPAVGTPPMADLFESGAAVPLQPPPNPLAVTQSEPAAPPTVPGDDSQPLQAQTSAPSNFDRAIQAAQAKIEDGQLYEALFTLSLHYGDPEFSPEQQKQLLAQLDSLAGQVIYSNEHLVEGAYLVQRGETLQQIAERYKVPWQLLANINGIENPDVVLPGTKLKVVPGPFRAEVDLQVQELTLFIGRLYAGRFPISIGQDPSPQPGDYVVADKQAGRTYYAGDGRTIAASDPTNPYGGIWLDLGGDVCIHGSPRAGETRLGCISLSPVDANDLYGILSQGSSVVIRR